MLDRTVTAVKHNVTENRALLSEPVQERRWAGSEERDLYCAQGPRLVYSLDFH